MLVIAGDQSSGKSSVVEAIAGVPLPRSDGTACTRCPTEVRMRTQPPPSPPPMQPPGGKGAADSPAGPDAAGGAAGKDAANDAAAAGQHHSAWKCHIKLCRDYDSDGKPLAKKPREELFCTVADKAHVAAAVSAAQAVLLNPRAVEGAPAAAFVPPELGGSRPSHRPTYAEKLRALGNPASYELAFTPNKVVLEINGVEADLTIVDLPGIIHDHPQGRHLVEVVERMVKQALAPAHHIIAMALPAGLDPETRAIRLWAREVDPEGRRSIGIITKPDHIPEDAFISCSKLIKLVGARGTPPAAGSGAADGHLRLGYYVVKNPSQEQLAAGISFEQARASEASYFAAHKHWRPATAAPALARRVGATALRDGLSALLVEQIEAQLPDMRRAAREQLEAVRAELAGMPPAITDAPRKLVKLLWRVADTLDAHAQGDSRVGKCAFYQLTTASYRAYGKAAMRSMPAFLVGTTLISALSKSDKAMYDIADPAAVAAAAATTAAAGGGKGTAAPQQQQLQQTWDEGELQLAKLGPPLLGKNAPTIETDADAHAALVDNEAVQRLLEAHLFPDGHMTLAEVTDEVLRERLGRELPGFCPYTAMEELLRRFKGQWREQAEACLLEVAAAAHELAGRTVVEHFSRYPEGARAVGAALSRHVEGLVDATGRRLEQLLGMEAADVYTADTAHLRQLQAAFLARLKRAYVRPVRLDSREQDEVDALVSQLASYGARFPSFECAFLAQPTPVDDELHMAAACLAYFKVAFKLVQDQVPLTIRSTLLGRLGARRDLEAALQREVSDVAAVTHTRSHAQAAGGGGRPGGAAAAVR
ncbi:hypothetical protein HXX76_009115 [Chlamydomonas incerta]|uniref:Dynamin-type G domain-containing protein n=1 Tax=Chlamydomonas incerta TaxID=51695 RepID=A0A835T496_CHLIN|nr:hypothetical protein HXX76_009115 [Chlamydomonas incerta]|eukprot:KAG2432195.1 hypothetical protein HXX76_009115 [Chlamydomonas incerta]